MLDRFEFSFTGIIFGAVGIAVTLWGVVVLKNAKASASWSSVQGEVTESRVVSDTKRKSDGRRETYYRANVIYRYEIETTEYTCNKVSFGEVSTDRTSLAHEVVKRYPTGKEVQVYYDPKNPEKAVLETGVNLGSYAYLGMGLICIGVGVYSSYSRH